jgi:hypothetical protein
MRDSVWEQSPHVLERLVSGARCSGVVILLSRRLHDGRQGGVLLSGLHTKATNVHFSHVDTWDRKSVRYRSCPAEFHTQVAVHTSLRGNALPAWRHLSRGISQHGRLDLLSLLPGSY